MLKKMLWKMGTCSRLSERLIEDGRDSAKRVVSETIPFKFSLNPLDEGNGVSGDSFLAAGKAQFLGSGGFD